MTNVELKEARETVEVIADFVNKINTGKAEVRTLADGGFVIEIFYPKTVFRRFFHPQHSKEQADDAIVHLLNRAYRR